MAFILDFYLNLSFIKFFQLGKFPLNFVMFLLYCHIPMRVVLALLLFKWNQRKLSKQYTKNLPFSSKIIYLVGIRRFYTNHYTTKYSLIDFHLKNNTNTYFSCKLLFKWRKTSIVYNCFVCFLEDNHFLTTCNTQ